MSKPSSTEVEQAAIIDALLRIAEDEPISDFEESFWQVRAVKEAFDAAREEARESAICHGCKSQQLGQDPALGVGHTCHLSKDRARALP